jgi:hypothetical protein
MVADDFGQAADKVAGINAGSVTSKPKQSRERSLLTRASHHQH